MKRTCFRLAVCAVLLQHGASSEQERIAIRLQPKPNQTVHVRTTQRLSIELHLGPASAGSAGTAAQMNTEASLAYTQVNGTFDQNGRMDAQITIEKLELKQNINGVEKPQQDLSQFNGRLITAVLDRNSKLLDVKVPKEMEQAASILKQMVGAAYGPANVLPARDMTVGEKAEVPTAIPLRLPGATGPGAYQTRTATTLRAVERIGNDRIARLEQQIMSADPQAALLINGAGKMTVNLDQGFITESASEWSFAAENGLTGKSDAAKTGASRGTMTTTTAAHL